MDTVKHPYELLVRWDVSGLISGAHVQWRYVTRDGDEIVGETVSKAFAVALDDTPGFPFDDIINLTLQSALGTVNVLQAQLALAAAANKKLAAQVQQLSEDLATIEVRRARDVAAALKESPTGPGAVLQGGAEEQAAVAAARLHSYGLPPELAGDAPRDAALAQREVQAEPPAAEPPSAEPMPDMLARLVPEDVGRAGQRIWLRQRLQDLTSRLVSGGVLEPLSAAELVEHQELERYRGWFE